MTKRANRATMMRTLATLEAKQLRAQLETAHAALRLAKAALGPFVAEYPWQNAHDVDPLREALAAIDAVLR